MYIYVCLCMCIYIYIYIYIYTHTHTHTHTYIYIYIYTLICLLTYTWGSILYLETKWKEYERPTRILIISFNLPSKFAHFCNFHLVSRYKIDPLCCKEVSALPEQRGALSFDCIIKSRDSDVSCRHVRTYICFVFLPYSVFCILCPFINKYFLFFFYLHSYFISAIRECVRATVTSSRLHGRESAVHNNKYIFQDIVNVSICPNSVITCLIVE